MKTIIVGINAKFIHTNLAIRYLYTYTVKDHDTNFLEFTIKDNPSHIIKQILSLNPDLIGFSSYIWNIEIIKEIIYKIKDINPHIKILLGGPEVSYDIKYWFNTLPIDYLISGEGEYPFKLLLTHLENNLSLNNIPQLHYRHNQEIYTNTTEYCLDLTKLPTPYRLKSDINNLNNRIQYIESSRGCPYHCSYCLASLEKNVRFFDKEYVKGEILYLMKNGAKVFKFLDRTFNLRKDYALDIFTFLINNHEKECVFQFEITGELLDEEIINFLNEEAPKNLFRFEIGVQSTNDYTNLLVNRKQNFSKLKHNIELIQQGNKIDLHLDLIAGLPREDYQSFIKTFNDVFSLHPHELQLGFLKMLRGTKLRNEANIYQYHYQDNAPYELLDNADLSKDEISKIHQAEEILEKYYNSHRFEQTVTYIIKEYYRENNYQFFEDFGIYYDKYFDKYNYQLSDLCLRLISFLKTLNINTQYIESILKYDYLKNAKTKPKIYYNSDLSKEDKHDLFNYIIRKDYNLNLDILFRYTLAERLTINPLNYQIGTFYLIKFFHPNNNSILVIDKYE